MVELVRIKKSPKKYIQEFTFVSHSNSSKAHMNVVSQNVPFLNHIILLLKYIHFLYSFAGIIHFPPIFTQPKKETYLLSTCPCRMLPGWAKMKVFLGKFMSCHPGKVMLSSILGPGAGEHNGNTKKHKPALVSIINITYWLFHGDP